MGRFLRGTMKALLFLALAGLFLWGGCHVMGKHYVFWNGILISRTAETVNLSGKTMENPGPLGELTALRELDARNTDLSPEQYEWLQAQLPGCRILWDVPIQGVRYDQDTRAISVSSLTDGEIDLLRYLPRLTCVDVGQWEDYGRIQALRRKYPHCNVLYSVNIAGEWWGCDAVSLILRDANPEELLEKLPGLPGLQSVLLTGSIPERETLEDLMAAFPDIFFFWKMDAFGMTVETEMTELNLSGVSLENAGELRGFLPYLPALETLELNSEGLSAEELGALMVDYPDISFRFDVEIGGRKFSSQSKEIDLSNLPLASVKEVEDVLPCFPRLEKVIMCQCGIPSEEMDALNRRHENIRFVWSVDLAGMLYRTDAVHFTPNRWGLELTDENIADLRYCTDMVCVDIGHAKKVTSCAWAANMPALKYLVLAETGISDISPLAGLEQLVFLELFLTRVRDLSPLTGCTALEDINLCYTHGDPAPLGEMPWLKRIWWTGNWKARRDLPKLLPDTRMEFTSPSSTGKGWREGQHYYDMRDFIGMKYMTG